MGFYRNIISNAGATAVGSMAQLLLILVLSRLLDITAFAVFITSTAVVGFSEMASDYGVRMWATQRFALKKAPEQIFRTALAVKTSFSLLLVIAILLLPFEMLSIEQALVISLIACTQPSTDPLLWYLRGKERLDVEAAITLSWRIGNVVIIAVLANLTGDVTHLLIAWLFSNLTRIAVEWRIPLVRGVKVAGDEADQAVGLSKVMSVAGQVLPIGTAFIIIAIYQRLGVLILGEISVAETVAHFGAAYTLAASVGFVATSITASSFPKLARAVDSSDWNNATAVASQKLQLVMMLIMPVCVLGILIAPWVIELLYPSSFSPATVAMKALLPGLYISCINLSLKYLMNALNHNWADVVSVVLGMTVFVVLVFSARNEELLLITGLAWGLGELAIFLVKWAVLRKSSQDIRVKLCHHPLIYLALVCVFLISEY